MSQHDYVIDDQPGVTFRTDLNSVLSAIVSLNSGATEPATTYAHMWWRDTTTGALKIRNADNDAWVVIGYLDDSNFKDANYKVGSIAYSSEKDDYGNVLISRLNREVSRSTYSALFAEVGETYGRGDGSTTFNLPFVPAIISNAFESTSLPTTMYGHTLTTLADGKLLLVGGFNSAALDTCYVGTVSGATIAWEAATALPTTLYSHTTTLLSDGRVLVAGGHTGSGIVATTYLGTVSGTSISWVASTALPGARYLHSATILSDGKVLVGGGFFSGILDTTYVGTVSGGSISWASATSLPVPVYSFTLNLVDENTVLITGGAPTGSILSAAYLGAVSGTTITWYSSTDLPTALHHHSGVLLEDGRVLISGGLGTDEHSQCYVGTLSGNSIFWQPTASMRYAARQHAAALLNDGRVVIAGGILDTTKIDETNIFPIVFSGVRV